MAPRFLDRLTQKQRRPSRIHPKDGPTRDDSAPIKPCDMDNQTEEPLQRKRKLITSINGAVKRVMTGFKKLTMRDVDLPIVHSVTFEPAVEMVTTPEQELRYRGLRLDEMFGQFLKQCRELTATQAEHISIPPELLQEMASYTKLLQTCYLKDVSPEMVHGEQDETAVDGVLEVTAVGSASEVTTMGDAVEVITTACIPEASNSTGCDPEVINPTCMTKGVSVDEFIDLSYQAKINGTAEKQVETLNDVESIPIECVEAIPQAIYMPEEPPVSETDPVYQDENNADTPKPLALNDSIPSLSGLFENHNLSGSEVLAINTVRDCSANAEVLDLDTFRDCSASAEILSNRSDSPTLVQQRTSRSSFASNGSQRRMDPHIAYIVSLYESIQALVTDSDSE